MRTCAGVLALVVCATAITRDQFYPYGQGLDQTLPKGKEVPSPEHVLRVPIKFYGEMYESIFINNFGVLTFRADLSSFLNIEFPLPYPSIAAFYSNIDTTASGTVYYREADEPHILSKAEETVQYSFHDYYDFKPRNVFLATWIDVTYTSEKFMPQANNSFQIAIISNGTETFVEFLYPERDIQWYQPEPQIESLPDAKAQAGFVSEDGRIYELRGSGSSQIRNIVWWSNCQNPGQYIFRVGNINIDGNVLPPDNYNQTEIEIEEESKTCVQSGFSVCHQDAQCIDYASGICCQCKTGYYGNGKTCIKNNVPLRIHGKINGFINNHNLNDVDIQAYVVVNEGRAYTALSLVPHKLGNSLQLLNALGGVIGWLFAKPMGSAKNGYQLTGSSFSYTADISFPNTRDRITINQDFLGHDVFDQITVDTDIRGTLPELPSGTKLEIHDYEENYSLIEPGRLQSHSIRTFIDKFTGERIEQKITQTFTFSSCKFEPASDGNKTITTLKVSKNYLGYENHDNIVRYGMTNKIYNLGQDPCLDQNTCGQHSVCVVQGNSYMCVCEPGFTRINEGGQLFCTDIDECLAGTHNCDKHAKCLNTPGSFQCTCKGYFTGNGTSCVQSTLCSDSKCDENAQCVDNAIDGKAMCVCNYGYFGDGQFCLPSLANNETDSFVLPNCQALGCSCPQGYTIYRDNNSNQLCRVTTYVDADADNTPQTETESIYSQSPYLTSTGPSYSPTESSYTDSIYQRGEHSYQQGQDNYQQRRDGYQRGEESYQRRQDSYQRGQDNYQRGQDNYQRGQDNYQRGQDNYQRGQDNYQRGQDRFQQGENNYQERQDNFQQGQENYQQKQDNFQQGQENYQQKQDNFQQGQENYTPGQNNYQQVQDNLQQGQGNYRGQENDQQGQEQVKDKQENWEKQRNYPQYYQTSKEYHDTARNYEQSSENNYPRTQDYNYESTTVYYPQTSQTNYQRQDNIYQSTTENYQTERATPAAVIHPTADVRTAVDYGDDTLIPCTDDSDCPPNAVCSNDARNQRKHCVCPEGYVGDSVECIERTSCNCGEYAHCVTINTASNEYICVCNPGYHGDGYLCRPNFSCSNNSDCEFNAECKPDENTGDYVCQCVKGYMKDENDACILDAQLCNGAWCAAHASCLYDPDIDLNYCHCDNGFTGDGISHCTAEDRTCDIIDNCSPDAICSRLDDTFACVCKDGYVGDGYKCISERTCNTHPQSCDIHASCIKKHDEYVCECNAGYFGNGTVCTLNPRPAGNFLVASDGASLYRVPFHITRKNFATPLNSGASQIAVGIDVDCDMGSIYWADVVGLAIKTARYDGSDPDFFLTEDIKSPEGIAIDWTARNLFWTDSKKLTIEVANLDTKIRKVLFSTINISNPRGIAVHPHRGKIFWSDWKRKNPKIEWANMDGSERTIFLDKNSVALPNSLAIDWLEDRLCFADAGLSSIKCVSIDTMEQDTIVNNCSYPFGLAIYGQKFFWTDWKTLKIEYIDTETNIRGFVPIATASRRLYGVAVAPSRCPEMHSICMFRNGGCEYDQLCLPSGSNGRKCLDGDTTNSSQRRRRNLLLH